MFNDVKPFFFFKRDASYRVASIKLSKNASFDVVDDIEEVWTEVYPDYPMQGKYLNETFQMVYMLFELATSSLATFALFADRISLPYGMLLAAGIGGIVISWLTVATQAFTIAKTNPVNALYHE